jgi:plastocyanin
MSQLKQQDADYGIGRRAVLKCMAWVGTGLLWTIAGGVPRSLGIIHQAIVAEQKHSLMCLQLSDSHVGFETPANPNALGTPEEAIAKVRSMLRAIGPVARAEDARVRIDNFTFDPPPLTVKVRTMVTWRNENDILLAIASAERKFKSKALDSGDWYSYTFMEPRIQCSFCSLHPHMTETIAVRPKRANSN